MYFLHILLNIWGGSMTEATSTIVFTQTGQTKMFSNYVNYVYIEFNYFSTITNLLLLTFSENLKWPYSYAMDCITPFPSELFKHMK